jgi:DNA mismatch repair protein MutS2
MDQHSLSVLDFQKVREILANFTQTEIGREAALKIMPNPTPAWIENELNCIEELINLSEEPVLSSISDIRPILSQSASAELLSPYMLNQIRICLESLRKTKDFFNKRKERIQLVYHISRNLKTFEPIEQAIDKAIDQSGEVKDDASPELRRIRIELRRLRNEIVKRLEKITSSHIDIFQDQGLTLKGDRYVLPLKLEAKGKFPAILHDYSATGKTLFVEPLELVEDQNELAQFKSSETEEIKRILAMLSELVAQNRSDLLDSLSIIEQLDIINAKKGFSLRFDCTKPQITADGQLQIVNGRHPMLSLKKTEVVPLNFSFPDNTKIVLISGPNAGGKTVVLKTVGLFGLMLASGMYLPSKYVAMPLYQNIFADIGDEQSLESDLSSFSAHLLRVKQILQNVDQNSLVLLDEVGSSTAPEEGSALAIAILESLRERGTATLATSHFGQLKLFVHDTTGMANAAMEFRQKPTYRLIMGIPGESSTLEISQELGLPEPLIIRAKDYLGKDWLDLSEKIKNLSTELEKTETLNRALDQNKTELEKLKKEYESKVDQLKSFQDEEKKKFRRELVNILKTTRKDIENLVREIKEKNAEKSTIVEAKKYIANRMQGLIEEPQPSTTSVPVFKQGDYVFSKTFRKQGIVIDEDNKESITVAFGNIKMKLHPSDLEKVADAGPIKSIDYTPVEFNSKLTLRGMTQEEARETLDRFLDDALLAGVKNLTILHGKGKAVLKQMVWEKLRRDSRIETIKLAEPFEGGGGVTIVKLK